MLEILMISLGFVVYMTVGLAVYDGVMLYKLRMPSPKLNWLRKILMPLYRPIIPVVVFFVFLKILGKLCEQLAAQGQNMELRVVVTANENL